MYSAKDVVMLYHAEGCYILYVFDFELFLVIVYLETALLSDVSCPHPKCGAAAQL